MSDQNPTDATDDTTEEMIAPESTDSALTRDWPAPKPDGPSLMNPLTQRDFLELFSQTINRAFPTEEELNPKSEAGPGDTAEDPPRGS
tara:strand:+ start:58 stop:321 length:264 start_codon:yes stop_codon:yes gene_type:complete